MGIVRFQIGGHDGYKHIKNYHGEVWFQMLYKCTLLYYELWWHGICNALLQTQTASDGLGCRIWGHSLECPPRSIEVTPLNCLFNGLEVWRSDQSPNWVKSRFWPRMASEVRSEATLSPYIPLLAEYIYPLWLSNNYIFSPTEGQTGSNFARNWFYDIYQSNENRNENLLSV